jgi:hypothetical protein
MPQMTDSGNGTLSEQLLPTTKPNYALGLLTTRQICYVHRMSQLAIVTITCQRKRQNGITCARAYPGQEPAEGLQKGTMLFFSFIAMLE